MIAIIDYGVGNLFSLCSSLNSIGAEAVVTPDPDTIRKAEKLRASGLDQILLEEAARGKPVMGICLGMQMLFEESHEYGIHKGLGLIPGRVIPMAGYIPADLKVPHIGWNPLIIKGDKHPLLRYVEEGDCVYFVHSYFATDCKEAVIATAEYGRELTAAVARGNVMGCQFHPENSGKVGLSILKAFCEM